MPSLKLSSVLAVAALALPLASNAATIKVGEITTLSGPEAINGEQMDRGIQVFMKMHPQAPKGHKVEIIKRDDTGPNPPVAKRLATELVTRDKVDIITGVVYSPNAFAINDICKEAKVPFIIMNAGTASITEGCPYTSRVSFTMWQAANPLGKYAFEKLGIKTVAVAYANFAPGKDSVAAFTDGFTRAGGKIIADVPFPYPNIPDFTPFMQRVKDAKPDAVYVFIPAGKWATGVMKTYNDLGMAQAGIKIIGPGDITQDSELPNMGDAPLGVITIHHYSAAHKSKENEAFVKTWKEMFGPNSTPDFLGVQGYDGMAAIYHIIDVTNGKITGESATKALAGWRYMSPRGPIAIDPATREIIDNQYIRKVERVNGKLANVEFATIEMVQDPWREFGKK